MKFLCVPCDSPMKLQSVAPPERGSLSVVYSCPECGYEMAMLTNAYETQLVQSLGVRIGPEDSGRRERCEHSREMSLLRDDSGEKRPWIPPASGSPFVGLPRRRPGSRTFPSSSARWRELASRSSLRREAHRR